MNILEPLIKQFIRNANGGIDLTPLKADILSFLTRIQTSANPAPLQDQLGSQFTPLWRMELGSQHYDRAQSVWEGLLEIIKEWELANKSLVHKGTPYYFAAVTEILARRLERGFLLMHQALEEDNRTSPGAMTPARKFTFLDYASQDQYFRVFVSYTASRLEDRVKQYCTSRQRTLSFADFMARLKANSAPDLLLTFVYDVARLNEYEHEIMPEVRTSDLASILELQLLFELTKVAENLIKHNLKFPVDPKLLFLKLALHLLGIMGSTITEQQLKDVNAMFRNDFDDTLKQLLDQTLTLTSGRKPDRYECDILLSYGIRNSGAHSLKSYKIICDRFTEIVLCCLGSIILSVEVLY